MHTHGGNIYIEENRNKIDFSANINFLGMPNAVKQAAKAAVEACEHYPDVNYTDLYHAVSRMEGVPVRQIVCGNGAAEVIFSLVLARKPQKAVVIAPSFYEYEQALQTVSCQVKKYYLTKS